MGKLPLFKFDSKELIAALDERRDEIESQASVLARQSEMIDGLKASLAAANEREDNYKQLWEEALAKITNLNSVIALLDTRAIEKVKDKHREEIERKQITISGLREDLNRCLGWIAAKNDQHPVPTRPEPGDSRKFIERVMVNRKDEDSDYRGGWRPGERQ